MAKPVGGEAAVRIFPGARATDGASVTGAWPGQNFMALLARKARNELIRSLSATNEIYGKELFPMVAAEAPLRDRLKGRRII